MNDKPIHIENNSGFFAFAAKTLSNRAFLGLLVVLLGGWHFYKWWYVEDVCLARYRHADKVFKKQNDSKNAHTKGVEKSSAARGRMSEKARANKLRRVNDLADRHKTDAKLPAKNHGAIHDVR